MNTKSKLLIIGSALLVAVSGTAVAYNGYGNCFRGGPGFQAGGPNFQMPGNMCGRQPMNWKRFQGQGPMRGMGSSPMRGVYRLNDLTDEQLQQLNTLRQAQQEWRNNRQQSMLAHRAEVKAKVDAILTEEQRQTLDRWNQPRF